jgi:hypothetical protein
MDKLDRTKEHEAAEAYMKPLAAKLHTRLDTRQAADLVYWAHVAGQRLGRADALDEAARVVEKECHAGSAPCCCELQADRIRALKGPDGG